MAKKRNSITCHLCSLPKPNMVQCSVTRCSLSFCIDCINTLFDQNFHKQKYVSQCWICYSCGKICKCDLCLGNLPTRKRPTGMRQKTKPCASNAIDEGIQKQQKLKQSALQDHLQILKQEKKPEVIDTSSKIKIQDIQPQNIIQEYRTSIRETKKQQKIIENPEQVKVEHTEDNYAEFCYFQQSQRPEGAQQNFVPFFSLIPITNNFQFPGFTFFYF